MQFEFATTGRVIFGPGSSSRIESIASEFGSRPFRVTGSLAATDQSFIVRGEPSVSVVRDGAAICRARGCDVVIGVGGGSVVDAAKAIAALATNGGDPLDYLEVVGRGQPLLKSGLPYIAVPTTAGTGSEVTRNAVLGSPEHGVKASLRSPFILPRVAVVDPDLTLDLPPHLTASTGLDALTQLIEAYVSIRANAFTDPLCLEGIRRIASSLPTVYANPHDREGRSDMSFAALLGGMALANAGLGVIHGFAAPIGGRFDAPHGAICAALLPHGMQANICALRAMGYTGTDGVRRYAQVARTLTLDETATAEDGVEFVKKLCADLKIAGLDTYGIAEGDVDSLVTQALKANSMKANPVVLTAAELTRTLRAAL